MGLGLPTLFFRRQIRSRFVWQDPRLALFPLEPMVLVTQPLSFLRLARPLWPTGLPLSSSDTGPLAADLHLQWLWDRNLVSSQICGERKTFEGVMLTEMGILLGGKDGVKLQHHI